MILQFVALGARSDITPLLGSQMLWGGDAALREVLQLQFTEQNNSRPI